MVLVEEHQAPLQGMMEVKVVTLPLEFLAALQLFLLEVDSVLDITDLVVQVDLVVVVLTHLVQQLQIKEKAQQIKDMMVVMVMILETQEWVVVAVALAKLVVTLLDPDLLDQVEMVCHHRSLEPQ